MAARNDAAFVGIADHCIPVFPLETETDVSRKDRGQRCVNKGGGGECLRCAGELAAAFRAECEMAAVVVCSVKSLVRGKVSCRVLSRKF